MKEKRDIDELLSDLEKVLPPVVFRNWKRWSDIIPISPRTLANEDCLHTGPSERVMVGRVIGYPKAALIDWLRQRSKVV